MWALILLGLLVGATVSAAEPDAWSKGYLYQYELKSKALTALHEVANQFSGVQIEGNLHVQLINSSTVAFQLDDFRVAEVHQNLSGGWDADIPESQLSFQSFKLPSNVFYLNYTNGVISNVTVSKKVPLWFVNWVKGQASVFQLDVRGSNRVSRPVPGGDSDIYWTMEDVITGKCQTAYVYAPYPKYAALSDNDIEPENWEDDSKLYTVSKAVNYTKCEKRAGYTWGLNTVTRWEPIENSVGQTISRSSNTEAVISGSIRKYTIQKSVTTNRVILNPLVYNQQKGMLGSQVKISLQRKMKSDKPIPKISDPVTYDDLVYEYEGTFPLKHADEAQGRGYSDEPSEESEERAYRPRRQFKRAVWDNADESDSSSSSSSSEEDLEIPEPDLLQPPLLPFSNMEQPQDKPDISAIIELVEKIARQIQEPSSIPSSDTLASFQILNRELMKYGVTSLRQIANKLYAPYPADSHSYPQSVKYTQWVVFINALSQSGTGPAIRTINEQIKLQKLRGRLAAIAIGNIPRSALYPNKAFLKEFFMIVKNTEKYSPENATALLGFGNLLRLAIVDRDSSHNLYPVHLYGKLDSPSESELQAYVKYLGNLLNRAVQNADSVGIQVYTRALGNIGHPYILKPLLPYILGEKQVSNFQRLLMVLALDRVAELYPQIVRPVLVQIYQSTGETHQIRSTAVLLIMGSKPSASVLQRLAQFSKQDPNPHVVSVVKTAIQSAARLTTPENEDLARSAMAAVNMLSQNKTAVQYSAKHLQDYLIREMALSYNLKYSQLGSKDTLIPNALYAGLKLNIGGFQHLAGEAQAAVSSIKTLQHLLRYIIVEGDENENQPTKDPVINIVSDLREQLEGQIAGNVMAHPSIIAFDNNTINSWVEAIRNNVNKLQNGLPFNCTSIVSAVDVRIFFPNALGFPSSIVYETPVLYSVGGELRLKTSPKLNSAPKGHLAWPTVWNITADVRAVYSRRSSGSILFTVLPLDKSYSAGYVKNQQYQVPVRFLVNVDLEDNSTYVKLQPINKNHRYQLSHMSSVPYTTIYRMSPVESAALTAPETEIVHTRKPRSWKAQYGRSTGMVYSVEYNSEKDYDDMYERYQKYANRDALSAILFFNAEQQVYYSNISLYYEPEKSISKAVELNVHYYDELSSSSSRRRPEQSEESQESEDQPESRVASEEMSDEPESAESSQEKYYRSKRGAMLWGRAKHRREASGQNRAALSNVNPNESHKELVQRLKEQGLAKSVTTKALLVGVNFVEGKGASSLLAIVWSSSPVSSKSQLLAFASVKGAQASTPYQVCVEAQSVFPNVPFMNLEKALKTNPNSSVSVRLDSGEGSCLSGMSIQANLDIGRSQSMYQYLQKSRLVAQCRSQMKEDNYVLPACRNATIKAGVLNNYDLEVEYQNIPEALKHSIYRAYSNMDYAHFLYGSQNVVNGTGAPGKLYANLIVAPNMRSLNFSFSSAYLDAAYDNVRLVMPVAKAIVSHPLLPRAERVANYYTNWQYNATCSVDSSYIKTYDNLTYPFESKSPCWRILLATARQRDVKPSPLVPSPNVTVMVREISDKREVRVLVDDNVVSLAYQSGKYMLRANSKAAAVSQSEVTQLNDKEGEPLVLAYALPDSVRMEIQDLIIYFDQQRVLLQPSDIYRQAVRGLCGTFDGKRQTDFKLPANCIVRNVTAFIEAYTYGDKCAAPRRAQPKQCYEEKIIPGNQTTPEPLTDATCVSLQNRVVLRGQKVCISRKRLPMCKWECKAVDTVDKVVPFRCYSRTETVETVAAQAQRGRHVDLYSIPIEGDDTNIEVSVATACTRLEESEESDSDEN
uniref:Vitellogenin B n=1 Tax=Schistocerca gregaria TaxID=7010 RepID=A0A8E5JT38_SCHGR|nr:Vitellogenin B [Schistocerca gregaria]